MCGPQITFTVIIAIIIWPFPFWKIAARPPRDSFRRALHHRNGSSKPFPRKLLPEKQRFDRASHFRMHYVYKNASPCNQRTFLNALASPSPSSGWVTERSSPAGGSSPCPPPFHLTPIALCLLSAASWFLRLRPFRPLCASCIRRNVSAYCSVVFALSLFWVDTSFSFVSLKQ